MARLQQARGALQRVLACLILALSLASCASNEEQAIRHLVVAELIQRERLPESQIDVRSVRFLSAQQAEVTARVRGQGTRADSWRTFHCSLQRDPSPSSDGLGRWTVRRIGEE